MRPRLKDFFSFQILILICFNPASSPAQDLTYPVAVSPLIGDTIDIGERARYGLFPKVAGFRHGEFYLQADSTLVARVTFDSGNGLRDTILTRLGTLAFMRGHLEGIDQKLIREQVGTALGRRGRVIQVLNRDTVVTRGELIAATPSMLYVNTFPAYRDVESDKLRPETIVRFPLQNISRILVEGESRTGRDMGIGALVGFGVGAVAGFIAASSDDPDDTGYQFGVAGLMGLPGAAAGMIVGLVVGLLESAQGEEHAISTPSDILKLRPHARFPEDPPAYLVG